MPPTPKRAAERLGHAHEKKGLLPNVDSVRIVGPVKPPALPKGLHPDAGRWYRSLRQSGQARYFEPSDWALAVVIARQMSNLSSLGAASNANLFKTVMEAAESLLSTESSRRRARIEVERVTGNDGEKPKEIRDYRSRLALVDSSGASATSADGPAEPAATQPGEPDMGVGGGAVPPA